MGEIRPLRKEDHSPTGDSFLPFARALEVYHAFLDVLADLLEEEGS